MDEKKLRSPAVRKILTMALLLGISGTFMAFYYIVYLPQQQSDFNQRMFGILHDVAANFSTRAENYGAVSSNSYINKTYPDPRIPFDSNYNNFDDVFKKSFTGNADTLAKFSSEQQFKQDSVTYKIRKDKHPVDSSKKALSDILEQLISIHANSFESVMLVKLISDSTKKSSGDGRKYDAILYKSPGLDIANINTDSLFPNKSLKAAALNEIKIVGVKYKMFLMPFKMKVAPNETFVLAGMISINNYNKQSQNIPLDFLVTVIFILVFLLLCLPFFKIFVLNSQENITVADVRFMVASIFIIPFIITLLTSSVWLYFYPDRFTNNVLSSLQNEVQSNFYKEIQACIDQGKDYNAIIMNPSMKIWEEDTIHKTGDGNDLVNRKLRKDVRYMKGLQSSDMKDIVFYPAHYLNIDNVHWMDSSGKDIASWRFTKDTASYFNLKDRQYFKDIKYKSGYVHPVSGDIFSLQATLSKLTGEYTLNVVIPSCVRLSPERKSIATGISSRMYSVYNTVVPPDFSYCLIDQKGEIVFHSDTARSLQGNLLEETGNNHYIKNAMAHKDSLYIDNVELYDEPVKMIIKPFDGLPYYLVTYYNKRSEYLFIFHIEAFVFMCMSILLLFVSLFSYCIMMINKKSTKLLFNPGMLNWLKPTSDKKDYYIRNCIQQITSLLLVLLFSFFLSEEQGRLYMLNCALLLPLFSITGFYIVKRVKNIVELNKRRSQQGMLLIGKNQLWKLLWQVKTVLLLFVVSVLVFLSLQDVLIFNRFCPDADSVKLRVRSLTVISLIVMFLVAAINIDHIRAMAIKKIKKSSYLHEKLVKCREFFQIHYLTPYLISLLLLVTVISVVPAITLTGYALNEERILHFQTYEMGLAKKIQERRTVVNPRLWLTKIDKLRDTANAFVNSLKFSPDKGLYLGGLSLETKEFTDTFNFNPGKRPSKKDVSEKMDSFPNGMNRMVNCSPFYKIITQFLFLPPDHDEFYDNVNNSEFYYWIKTTHIAKAGNPKGKETDSLHLYYNNLTDHKSPASIILGGEIPYFYLFKDITGNYVTSLLLLAVIIFVVLFYKIIYSVAKKIFMTEYFRDDKTKNADWFRKEYDYFIKPAELIKTGCFTDSAQDFNSIRAKENHLVANGKDEEILKIQLALNYAYERIWNDCNDAEKFTLYDFALDGFTNYKKVISLLKLYQKGLLIREEDNFRLMTTSFRNFLLTKESSETIRTLSKQGKGSWATMRNVFYVILLIVAVFIFLSQEEASKRLLTIVTSLGALLPAILKLFDKSTFSTGTSKPNS